jgi:hypothetical protein
MGRSEDEKALRDAVLLTAADDDPGSAGKLFWPSKGCQRANPTCRPRPSVLRQTGVTSAALLVVVNLGLRSIPVDQRRHPRRETRLLAIARGLVAAAEAGLKEHDRLVLARHVMERKLIGRRTSSKLPELIEMVIGRPLVHSGNRQLNISLTEAELADVKALAELAGQRPVDYGRSRILADRMGRLAKSG